MSFTNNNFFREINGVEPIQPTPKPKLSNHFLEINGALPKPSPRPQPRPAPTPAPEPVVYNPPYNNASNVLFNSLLNSQPAPTPSPVFISPPAPDPFPAPSLFHASLLAQQDPQPQPVPTPAPAPDPVENRFNDAVDDETLINGRDASTNDESDAFYYYYGIDGGGAEAFGTGLVDYQNDDPDHWFQSFEILTFDSRSNYDPATYFNPNADFYGYNMEANVLDFEVQPGGQHVNVGYLSADLTIGGDADGIGFMAAANLAEISYRNGDPSPDNDSDENVGFSLSQGAPLGGALFHYNDPDGDGVKNAGFEVAGGPVGFYYSSEELGDNVEATGELLVEARDGVASDIAYLSVGQAPPGGNYFERKWDEMKNVFRMFG